MKAGKYKVSWCHVDNLVTHCYLSIDNIEDETPGYCLCNKGDNFSRDIGRKLSLVRVLRRSNIPKEDRKLIWETYRTMTVKPRW
jgi:hypothetical protein